MILFRRADGYEFCLPMDECPPYFYVPRERPDRYSLEEPTLAEACAQPGSRRFRRVDVPYTGHVSHYVEDAAPAPPEERITMLYRHRRRHDP